MEVRRKKKKMQVYGRASEEGVEDEVDDGHCIGCKKAKKESSRKRLINKTDDD